MTYRPDGYEDLQCATRNNEKAQLDNIWNIIDRVELTDDERDEICTCMAWIKEDLEAYYYGEDEVEKLKEENAQLKRENEFFKRR